MKTINQNDFQKYIDLLPKTTTLRYVDYRDSFDGWEEKIGHAIRTGCFDDFYMELDECFWEQEGDSVQQYIDDVINEIDIDELENLDRDSLEELLRDEVYERSDDDIIKDLSRNTGRMIAFYDTGYYVESGSWSWSEAEIRLERMRIKQFLGIKSSAHDKDLDLMIAQASYGGQLQIYFELDLETFMGDLSDIKTISFTDYAIGIIDSWNGSGDVIDCLKGESATLPFNRQNIFLEKEIKYNWTYEIAGMVSNWADSTVVELSKTETDKEPLDSPLNAMQEKERQYNDTYKAGGCTFGDMDIERHQGTYYDNNFPCGTRCKNCGTFWID